MAKMTLPISLHVDVNFEFGSNTRPANETLTTFRNAIFGSGAGSLTDFVGTGRPFASTDAQTNVNHNSATLNGTVDEAGGLTTTYYFEYDTDNSFGSPSTTSTGTTNTDGASFSKNISGLSSNTTYYFRAVVYNNYVSNSADHIPDVLGSKSFTTPCDPPTNFSHGPRGTTYPLSWTAPSGGTPSSGYQLQYRKNLGTWTTEANNIMTESYSFDACSNGFGSGDNIDFRIRSVCSGNTSSWNTMTNAIDTNC